MIDLVHVGDERAVEVVGELGVFGLQSEFGAGERDQLVPLGLRHLAPTVAVVRLLEDRSTFSRSRGRRCAERLPVSPVGGLNIA